ncbi:hypothetical protein ACFSTI_29260 [Rhizorhabdus histidinilytica]
MAGRENALIGARRCPFNANETGIAAIDVPKACRIGGVLTPGQRMELGAILISDIAEASQIGIVGYPIAGCEIAKALAGVPQRAT